MVIRTRRARLDYCLYPVSSQIKYTLTNKAFHSLKFSHDPLNRFLRDDKLTPRPVWEQTRRRLITSPNGYLLFDDIVTGLERCQCRTGSIPRNYSAGLGSAQRTG